MFNNSMKTYAYRRVAQALKEEYSVIMNKKKVARLMHKYHIIPRYARDRRPNNTKKRIECNVKANLLKRQFNVDAPDKVWFTDVTYLRVKGKTWYLSTIMDLYDRSIVSFKIHFCNNLELVFQTLGLARLVRYNAKEAICQHLFQNIFIFFIILLTLMRLINILIIKERYLYEKIHTTL